MPAEAIAVVGIGCRFPGARGPEAFWQLLRGGVDAVGEVPAERWNADAYYDADPSVPGRMVTRWGGFLADVDKFDPDFFGISPREAARMDPQQRLMLETAWEALEHAGISPDGLRGGDAGVFIGIGNTDYTRMLCHDIAAIDRYDGTGGTLSFAANRFSYFLDLHGPSLGMESACSSSLVALHTACKSLRDGETSLAIMGGVNLVLSPDMTVAFSQARMMSPTGRCRAFDAAADGYVRGEGCGVLILKRHGDAVRDGDNILALIRGSAINQDGTSNGITAPNGAAQQAVIRKACESAGIAPGLISYVEAHGTGTKVGDPIEIRALKAVLSEGRPEGLRCHIGSVKTNIGHLEAAAGMAGLLKTVLMLQHKEIAPHLHLHALNPYISFAGTPLDIPTVRTPWNAGDTPRIAGVSGFSFGGTNCHVILEEAPPAPPREAPADEAAILTLSARSEEALREMATAYAAHLTDTQTPLADIAATAALGRAHFQHRLAAAGASRPQVAQALSDWGAGNANPAAVHGMAPRGRAPDVVFLFTGQGSSTVGMGRRLAARFAPFRETLAQCDAVLRAIGSRSILSDVLNSDDPSTLADAAVVQPALFAIEVALARLWRSWGVVPKAVMGHSLGEYAAACVAGVFSLEEGLSLVAERGRLTAQLAQTGAMAAVFAPAEELREALKPHAHAVAIAAINGPRNTVLSGDAAVLDTVLRVLSRAGIDSQRLDTTHAFHSPLIAPMLPGLDAAARRISHAAPAIPLVAGLSGAAWPSGQAPDAAYWGRHLREPVQFLDGLRAVAGDARKIFVEIGPGSALARLGTRCGLRDDAVWVPSLPAGRDEAEGMLAALGTLYVQGCEIDWRGVHAQADGARAVLPTYPFRRQRYWYTDEAAAAPAVVPLPPPPAEIKPATGNQAESLRAILGKLLRKAPAAIDMDASFLELGADSLVLVDAVHQVDRAFGVKVSVKQLFEEFPTPAALAAHIGARSTTASMPALPAPAQELGPLPAASGDIAALMQQQLRIIAQQLEILQAHGAPARQEIAAPPPPSVPKTSPPSPAPSALSPEQKRYVESLTARYVARTQASRNRAQRTRGVLADSRASAGFRPSIKEMLYPVVGDAAQGAHIRDVDGNDYVDIAMGFGVLLFGHNPPFVAEAIAEQARKGLQIGPQSGLAGDVAALVCELTGAERAAFCNSGTEAVMTALRLARAATGRGKIVLFAGSYHGHSDGVLAAATAMPSSAGVNDSAVSDVVVLEYGAAQSLDWIAAHAGELAAVLVEPVQSRNPDLQPREFLQRLRALTAQTGTVLVFDEVLTGFRVHPGGAQALFGVQADIAAYGKVIGGGLPIGVVAGRASLLDGIDGGAWDYGDASHPRANTVFFAGTFNKNHLGMAAACAVLRHLKAEGPALQEALNARTAELTRTLNGYFTAHGLPLHVARFGSLFRFQTHENIDPFFYSLCEKGIYVWEGRTCFLSTEHSEADIARIVDAVCSTVDEMLAAGWFAGARDAAAHEAASFPAPPQLHARLLPQRAELRRANDLASYDRGIAQMERLAADYVRKAFADLGYRPSAGEVFTTSDLARRLSIVDGQRKLFARLLEILGEEGDLALAGPDAWRVVSVVPADDPQAQARDLKAQCPAVAQELDMFARCGAALAEVLSGRRHALELLFPGGDFGSALALYANSPMARTVNTLLRGAVDLAAADMPAGRTLRIVELGAGTGGSTGYLLPALAQRDVEYVFTDLSPRFLDAARRRFAAYPFVQYRLLDVEQAPEPGPLADIVIAANVLHATADLRETLAHVEALLKPGGLLLLLEGTGRARWLDLVFGLTEGWWRFADPALRPHHALLDSAAWTDVLGQSGFADIAALSSGPAPSAGEQTLLIAAKPVRTALSDAQRALWTLSRFGDAASAAYHESIAIVLQGPLDRRALDAAVQHLAARHDALRMRIDAAGHHQTPDAQVSEPVFADLSGDGAEARADAWAEAAAAAPFDLVSGPPVRFALLRLAPDTHRLVVTAHHIVVDGQSLATMARELGLLYSALSRGEAPDLPPAPQFAAYLARNAQPEALRAQAEDQAYWLDALAKPVPRTELPLDRPRGAVQSFRGARLRRPMSGELSARLAQAAAQQGCTLFMLLLAGLHTLLHVLTRASDNIVGISAAGQNAQGCAELVGYCVQVLPLRLQTAPDDSFKDVLHKLRPALLDAQAHQQVSLARLVGALGVARDPARAALIDVHFNYDKWENDAAFFGLAAELRTHFSGFVRRDLTWNPVENADGLAVVCDYASELFDAATVEGWMADYEWILDMATRQPDLSLSAVAQGLSAAKAGALKLVSGERLKSARRKPAGRP